MSICVCAKCKQPWKASGSPAECVHCGDASFAIVAKDPECRAKQSAAAKKQWQDPDYRARMIAAHIGKPSPNRGKHATAEARANISVALTGKHHTAEARAKIAAAHKGKHHTAETRAKLSASLRRWHNKRGSPTPDNSPELPASP